MNVGVASGGGCRLLLVQRHERWYQSAMKQLAGMSPDIKDARAQPLRKASDKQAYSE